MDTHALPFQMLHCLHVANIVCTHGVLKIHATTSRAPKRNCLLQALGPQYVPTIQHCYGRCVGNLRVSSAQVQHETIKHGGPRSALKYEACCIIGGAVLSLG